MVQPRNEQLVQEKHKYGCLSSMLWQFLARMQAPHSFLIFSFPFPPPIFPPFAQSKFSLRTKLFSDAGLHRLPWRRAGRQRAALAGERTAPDPEKNPSLCQAPLNPFCPAQCGLTETILPLTNGEEARLESARDGSFIFTHTSVRDALNASGLEEVNNNASTCCGVYC